MPSSRVARVSLLSTLSGLNGKRVFHKKKKRVGICITDSFCWTAETNTLYINYISTKIFLNTIKQILLK